jgi:probable HAF family extracellular repeat protein
MRHTIHLLTIFGLAVSASEGQTQLYNVTDLGDLGGQNSGGTGINASGHVTGSVAVLNTADNSWYPHAFSFDGQSMTDLGTLPLGTYTLSYGTAINSLGEIVGYSAGSTSGTNLQHAFLYTPSKGLTDLGAQLNPALTTAATGINVWGKIAGYAFDGSTYSSWLYTPSTTTTGKIQTLTSAQQLGMSQAVAINDVGLVLVHLWPTQGGSLCYLWIGGAMVRLPVAPTCVPAAISNAGYVTGDLYSGSYAHAFFYKLGAAAGTDLGTLAPGSATAQSHGYAVNNAGAIVGTSVAADGFDHAFLYANGTMIDLNTAIPQGTAWAYLQTANGINQGGQITGSGWIHTQGGSGPCVPGGDCAMHAFRLDPR